MLTPRERFKRICRFELPDDFFTFGLFCWNETYDRWISEGMPVRNMENVKEVNMHFLGHNNQNEILAPNGAIMGLGKNLNPPWAPPLVPLFPVEILEDLGEHVLLRDADGAIVERRKGDTTSMPKYVKYPVEDAASWEAYKKRLDPCTPERFPAGWDIMSDENMMWPIRPEHDGKGWEQRDFPLGMFLISLFGMPRDHLGLEGFSYAMVDNPSLLQEMMECHAHLAEELLKKVFAAGISLEWVWVWEDIACNTGALIPPGFVKQNMHRYRRVTDLLHSHHVDAIIVDSDGNLDELLPLWMDSGINATYPLERAAGMDAGRLRRKYGKNLITFGNIDKRNLAKGQREIDGELEKARELLKGSGHFPGCDHHVPPDVSYSNIKYLFNGLFQMNADPQLRRKIT
jgi:hypothetical protein